MNKPLGACIDHHYHDYWEVTIEMSDKHYYLHLVINKNIKGQVITEPFIKAILNSQNQLKQQTCVLYQTYIVNIKVPLLHSSTLTLRPR